VPDDRTNFFHILSNPSDFYGATPYTYWFAALLILVFGPGLFAVDSVLGYFAKLKQSQLTDGLNTTS
jgi:putative oxidoreductase